MFRRMVLSGPVSALKSLLNLSLRLFNPGRDKNKYNYVVSAAATYITCP